MAPPARPAVRRAGLDQSGRISVIVYSTMLSSYVALAIPIYAESEGSAAYGLALLLGPPAGLVTSIYATRNRQVTAAQSDVYVLAGNMGLWHGLAIGLIEDLEGHEVAGTAAIGGAAGAVTGALLVSPGHTRETAASLASLAAPCGIWFGLITNEIFASGRPANEVDTGTSDEGDRRIGAMLLGGDAALLAAVLTERRLELSRDRARLIGLTGAAGAAVGGAIDLLFSIRDRQAWGMVGAGTAGGLVAGLALTADYDTKRGFSDPLHPESSSLSSDPGSGDPRSTDSSSRFRGAGLTATVMPLRLRALSPAGPATPRWREALKRIGVSGAPAVGLTLLEARF